MIIHNLGQSSGSFKREAMEIRTSSLPLFLTFIYVRKKVLAVTIAAPIDDYT